MRRQTQTKHKERRAKEHRRLSAMQIAVFVIGAIVFLCAAGFGGYLLYEEAQYQKALRNYPVAYVDFIAQYAEKYELDPYLVQSIMRCESSNDPNAVSHAGAIGLMQIMPDTGEWIGHKIDPELAYSLDMLSTTPQRISNTAAGISAFSAAGLTARGWRSSRPTTQVTAAWKTGSATRDFPMPGCSPSSRLKKPRVITGKSWPRMTTTLRYIPTCLQNPHRLRMLSASESRAILNQINRRTPFCSN